MIAFKLKEEMEGFSERSGERMTYERLAEKTGIARATLEAIGSRPGYNTTLETIDKNCRALKCDLGDLLELRPGEQPAR